MFILHLIIMFKFTWKLVGHMEACEVQSEPKVSGPSLSKCIEIRLRTQWLFLKQDTLPGKWSKSVDFSEIHCFMTAHEHTSLLLDVDFIN